MADTSGYGITGDPYTDGVLSGVRWTSGTLTYSFPDNYLLYGQDYSSEPTKNFEAFNSVQVGATRQILTSYASITGLNFVEIRETGSQHADLRLAESDAPTTAWAYFPTTAAAGGDAWFNNSKGWYDNPVKGNYAWAALTHELGHALGLKHPHEAMGSFGATPGDQDSLEYSVMSYRSFIGGSTTKGYSNGSVDYPQSLMMNDIAALQEMYGANYGFNAGNSVYAWNPNTGETSINGAGQGTPAGNRVFLTIWDGGGHDTYDFSNYGNDLSVSLQPGQWSAMSTAQLANLGYGHLAAGNIANAKLHHNNTGSLIEDAVGGSGNDTITGNGADNWLTGSAGNDHLIGKAGKDSAVYSGKTADYSLVDNHDGSWTISDLRDASPDGIDVVESISLIRFSDGTLDIGGDEINHAPEARKDTYRTTENKKLVINAGVLHNDFDKDGNLLSADLVNKPGKGRLIFDDDGSFVFRPAKGFTGKVSFRYEANDGTTDSDAARVTIKVGKSAKHNDDHDHGSVGHTVDDMLGPSHRGHNHVSDTAQPVVAGDVQYSLGSTGYLLGI